LVLGYHITYEWAGVELKISSKLQYYEKNSFWLHCWVQQPRMPRLAGQRGAETRLHTP